MLAFAKQRASDDPETYEHPGQDKLSRFSVGQDCAMQGCNLDGFIQGFLKLQT